MCFRDSSEVRLPEAQADLERPAGPELEPNDATWNGPGPEHDHSITRDGNA